MKLKKKSLILSSLIALSVISPVMARDGVTMYPGEQGRNETSCGCSKLPVIHKVGVIRKSNSNGTCGLSYVGRDGYDLGTQVHVGPQTQIATGYGWAQTNTMCKGQDTTVSETHWQQY
ncbi:hypothetical protein DP130_07170 [Clostridium tetani]|uniref:Bacteriocin n=1 Tax=Clostridium tetani TaxID=1513 RepID=A0A4V1LEM7_CLOTA|nr:hypothetical protein [Clostridium tetani]RXI48505.1 hypothetical protein DP130_07170 [Clostridium tetani]